MAGRYPGDPSDVLIFAFSAYWCVNAAKLCESLSKLTFADLKLPYNAIYYAEPVGAAIVCIFCVEILVRKIVALKKDWRVNHADTYCGHILCAAGYRNAYSILHGNIRRLCYPS